MHLEFHMVDPRRINGTSCRRTVKYTKSTTVIVMRDPGIFYVRKLIVIELKPDTTEIRCRTGLKGKVFYIHKLKGSHLTLETLGNMKILSS